MHLSYNTKLLFTTDEDKVKILSVLEKQRFAWNEASKIQFALPQNSIIDLHAKFYVNFRQTYSEIPSQVVIRAEQECLSAYRSIKSNRQKITQPAEKKRLSMRLDKRIYSYKSGVLSLISLSKRVKCKFHLYDRLSKVLNRYKFLDPLIYEKNGEVWISLTFDLPEILPQNNIAVGIDLGCRVNAATSEGNLYIDKKFNQEKRQLRHLKSTLKSKGTKSAHKHLRKVKHKERNKNKNFTHNLVNKVISGTQADILVIENLEKIKVKKNQHQKKNRMSQMGFYKFREFLTYKAPLYGKTVIQVSPTYSSQTDFYTGKRDGERKGRRYLSKSGQVYCADCNAAAVIASRSGHPLSYLRIVEGQAIVNSPIVC